MENIILKEIIDRLVSNDYTIEQYPKLDLYNGFFLKAKKLGAEKLLQILYVYDDNKNKLKNYKNKVENFKENFSKLLKCYYYHNSINEFEFKTKDEKEIYSLVFEYQYPQSKIDNDSDLFLFSDERIWDEENFCFKDHNFIREKITKNNLINLLDDIKTLHENGTCFSYLSSLNLIYDNYPKWFMPYFSKLIDKYQEDKKDSSNIKYNYRAIFNDYKDLNIFCFDKYMLFNSFENNVKSDIWALGVLISLLEFNKLPFSEKSEEDYIKNTNTVNIDLEDSKFSNLIIDCLRYQPEQRISIDKLIEELQETDISPNEQFITNLNFDEVDNEIVSITDKSFEIKSGDIKDNSTIKINLSNEFFKDKYSLKKVILLFKNYNDQSAAGTIIKAIEILPIPEIVLHDKMCVLERKKEKSNDKTKENVSADYCGIIFFELKKAKAKIKSIKIHVDDEEVDKKQIKCKNFELSKITQIGIYEINFEHKIEKEDTKTIKVDFELEYLKDNENKYLTRHIHLKPRTKINLVIDNVSGHNTILKVIKGHNKSINLEIKPDIEIKDFDDMIKIEKVSIEPNYNFIDIKNEGKNITLVVKNPPNLKYIEGNFVINYIQYFDDGLDKKLNSKIDFSIYIIEPYDNKIRLAIDFGTTNSCIASHNPVDDNEMSLFKFNKLYKDNLENPKESIPSAITFESLDKVTIGPKSLNFYYELKDNTFISFKSKIDDNNKDEAIYYDGKFSQVKSYKDIIGDYIKYILKEFLEKETIKPKEIIFTHPIHLRDKNLTSFKEIAKNCIDFVYPNNNIEIKFIDEATASIIGSLDNEYFDTSINDVGSTILVYDFGGGTTDIVFSEIKISEDDSTLIPYYSKGYKIGGDNINKIIIDEIVNICNENSENKFVNYLKEANELSEISSVRIRQSLKQNRALLWKFSEFVKINVGNLKSAVCMDENTFLQYFTGNEYDLNSYNIAGETITLKKIFDKIKEDESFIKKINERFIQLLRKPIKETFNILINFVDKFNKIKIIITGQASLYPLVHKIFSYLLKENGNTELYEYSELFEIKNKLQKIDANKFDLGDIANKNKEPQKLKSVVVLGALNSITNPIFIDNQKLLFDIYLNGERRKKFGIGSTKINYDEVKKNMENINGNADKIINYFEERLEKNEFAIYKKEYNDFEKKIIPYQFRDEYGFSIRKCISIEHNKDDKLYFYVDLKDKIRCLKINKDKIDEYCFNE